MFISPKTQSTGDVLINKLPKPTFLTKSTRPNLSWTLMMILLWQHDDRCFHVFNLFLNGTSDGFISVGIIIMGAFIAGAQDLSFDSNGYAFVFLANICTAVYLASVARVGKSSGLNSFGLMWCNGIICGPLLLFWTIIRGDLNTIMKFPYLLSPIFQALIMLSSIMAFLLNYCLFWNTTLNSALTQTVCGNLKDVFTIALGWIVFGGLPFNLWNVVGQSLGFSGSCLYAYCKLKGK